MSARPTALSPELHAYLLAHSVRDLPILARLREETAGLPNGGMQISPEQGQLMQFLVKLIGARRCIEIGTFTGYSALITALALPADGQLVCCDVSEEFTAIARRYWAEAGVAAKIDLRIAPATETLDRLIDAGAAPFDFAFIDADKVNYDAYLERLLRMVRPGGLIGIDNVLWYGAVVDPAKQDPDTVALRALSAKLHRDERVDLAMIPIGDGLTLLRRR
jgi:predicted O-methyltransferase YrrM